MAKTASIPNAIHVALDEKQVLPVLFLFPYIKHVGEIRSRQGIPLCDRIFSTINIHAGFFGTEEYGIWVR
jgi:hypothetical protein